MPDYSKGVIYTIRCHSDTSLIYVGSTTQPLYKRWAGHKLGCFNPNKIDYNMNLYQKIRETSWDNWYIELYEEYPCDNVQQLHKREGEVIREIGNLNKNVAGRTGKQYYEEKKVEIAEKQKQYHKENKEKISKHRKQYYENNKQMFLDNSKTYREENKEKIAKKDKKYYEENKKEIAEYLKEYHNNNKKEINEQRREKVMCECGVNISKGYMSEHHKTQKHILWQATQTAATN